MGENVLAFWAPQIPPAQGTRTTGVVRTQWSRVDSPLLKYPPQSCIPNSSSKSPCDLTPPVVPYHVLLWKGCCTNRFRLSLRLCIGFVLSDHKLRLGPFSADDSRWGSRAAHRPSVSPGDKLHSKWSRIWATERTATTPEGIDPVNIYFCLVALFFLTNTSYRFGVRSYEPKITFFTGKGDGGVDGPREGRIVVELDGVSLYSVSYCTVS